MIVCKECGKPAPRSYGGMCQGCYLYFKKGGVVHPLPSAGCIKRDSNGKVICHICGRSYVKLGSHVRESHNMTIDEYKEKFGLCRRVKTTETMYSKFMRQEAFNHGMDKQMLEIGKSTRFKKGDTYMRKGKEIRLQEKLDKAARKGKCVKNGRT